MGIALLTYHFVVSTEAYVSSLPPGGAAGLIAVAILFVFAGWVVVPLLLLLAGLAHLRRVAGRRRKWPTAWAGVVAAAAALEGIVIYHFLFSVGPESAVRPPAADWDWSAVPQAAGLLLAGAAMIWLLTIAE